MLFHPKFKKCLHFFISSIWSVISMTYRSLLNSGELSFWSLTWIVTLALLSWGSNSTSSRATIEKLRSLTDSKSSLDGSLTRITKLTSLIPWSGLTYIGRTKSEKRKKKKAHEKVDFFQMNFPIEKSSRFLADRKSCAKMPHFEYA